MMGIPSRFAATAAFIVVGTRAYHEGTGGPCNVNAYQSSRWFENLAVMDDNCKQDGYPGDTCNLQCRYGYQGNEVQYTCHDSEWVINSTFAELPDCKMQDYFCRVTVYDSCDFRRHEDWTPLEQQEVPGEFPVSGTIKAIWVQGDNCIGQLSMQGNDDTPPWTFPTAPDSNEGWFTDCDHELPMGWGGMFDSFRVWRNLNEKCGIVSGYKFRKLRLAPCRAKFWIRNHVEE